MSPSRICPGCGSAKDFSLVEEHRDPIGGTQYRLQRCGDCELVFAEPRDAVGSDWYEKAAPLRAREMRRTPERDWRFRRFLRVGLPAGRLLDIGCGDGGFMKVAAARGWKTVGVDYDSRVIELARRDGLDASARDFFEFLKVRAAKEFDAITLFDVLEHVPEPRELIAAIKPVLKRGGHLAITFPNAGRPQPFGVEEYDYPPHHFTRWTRRSVRSLLEREGFAVVELSDVGPTATWFSETIFYGFIAPAALSAARRLLFGGEAAGSITQLYEAGSAQRSEARPDGLKGLLADKARRQDLVDVFKLACRFLTWPPGLLLSIVFRLVPGRGEYLYALARYDR